MKNIQQLALFSEQPEEQPEQSERDSTPAPVANAPQFSAAEIEAMQTKLLTWGQAHKSPGFGFSYGMYPPRNSDPDRRFGRLLKGKRGWMDNVAHYNQYERYPGEWLVKALEHVERFDKGIEGIPPQITSIADDRE